MSHMLEIAERIVSTEELQGVLEQLMSEHFNQPRQITRLSRTASDYHSSYAIEELNLQLDDGSNLDLIFKNLSSHALLAGAHGAKPDFIANPHREIEVYRRILSPRGLSVPKFYGARADDEAQTFWLFLEEAPGLELYQVGEIAIWQGVARWLAQMHDRFACEVPDFASYHNLLRRDARLFWTWMRRAEDFCRNLSAYDQDRMRRIAARFAEVVEILTSLPQTFIHGEFYASNVIVEERAGGLRVCPVDWEMAGTGPALIDLAALVSGKWTAPERAAIAMAYFSTMQSKTWQPRFAEFSKALDCCQLALAVQWLGWSRAWSPPLEHRQDWLSEAARLAEKLSEQR